MEAEDYFRELMTPNGYYNLDWAIDHCLIEHAERQPMGHPYRDLPSHSGGWRLTRKGIDFALTLPILL